VDDAALRAAASRGDREAFGRLALELAPTARRVARGILGSPEDADDAVQDAFLSAWRAIDRYDPARPLRPWLLRIVVNAATDLLRRRAARRAVALPADLPSGSASPEREAGRALLGDRLLAALATLPERQRTAVVLFDVEGWSHAEIADLLGVAEGTVRSDVFRARRALRPELEPYAGETG
jgi:RNA polymerase sigma-70 factor (ECF subfamily)